MSIREDAINGNLTEVFKNCAELEGVTPEFLMEGVAKGTIAIPKNNNHSFDKIMAVLVNVLSISRSGAERTKPACPLVDWN